MSTIVADLAAELRLEVHKSSWAQGEKLIESLHRLVEEYFAFETVKKIGEFFKGIVEGSIESAHGLEVLAQQIGVATGPLQELEYAARATGSSTEALTSGVGHFALVLDEANKGSQEAKKSLSGLGPEVMKLLKANAPLEDVLAGIAEKFHEMPDGTKKTALAMQVFGRGGRELIPLLNRGKEGLADLRKEFVALGGETASGDLKQLAELKKTTVDLGVAWDGIKGQIALALVPALKDVADSVLGWVKAHRELISTKIREWIADFVSGARQLWDVLQHQVWPVIVNDIVPAFMALIHAIEWAVGVVGGAGNAIKIFIGYLVVSRVVTFGLAVAGLAGNMISLATSATNALSVIGNLAKAGGGLAGGTGGALGGIGSVLGVGAAAYGGYQAGDWLSHKMGLHKGDKGYNDDYRDPRQEYYSDKNIAKRHALEGGIPGVVAPSYTPGGSSSRSTTHVTAPITVNVPAGTDGKAVGGFVQSAFREFWEREMRDAHEAVRQ